MKKNPNEHRIDEKKKKQELLVTQLKERIEVLQRSNSAGFTQDYIDLRNLLILFIIIIISGILLLVALQANTVYLLHVRCLWRLALHTEI